MKQDEQTPEKGVSSAGAMKLPFFLFLFNDGHFCVKHKGNDNNHVL